MAHLVIKGHTTRGKEIIELLKMLGTNRLGLKDTFVGFYYYIECGEVYFSDKYPIDSIIFTLEEFLEKFPYKIKDRVRVPEYESEVYISDMYWDGNEVQYEVVTDEVEWYSAKELNEYNEPYREEITEEPKELLIGFTKDTDGNWVLNTHADYEIKEVDGKFKLIQKQPQYPKTYEECYSVLEYEPDEDVVSCYSGKLIESFVKLLICRDAYWKIAGDWKPDYMNTTKESMHFIFCNGINIEKGQGLYPTNKVLIFPNKEMRNTFYNNFKDLIKQCKELL